MPERGPKTEKRSATGARQRIGDVPDRVTRDRTRVIVTADAPVAPGEFDGPDDPLVFPEIAAVVPIQDLWRSQALEAGRPESFDALSAFGERFEDVPVEEIEREVANAVAEGRAEQRGRQAWRLDAREVVAAMREPFKEVPPEAIEREVARTIAEGRREQPPATAKAAAGG